MKRSTLALIVLAVVLVTAVWFVFFISPKQGDISDIDDQISQSQVVAQGLRGQVAALKDIRDSELTYRRATAEVERSIPAAPELAAFIEDVNLLAIETNVEVGSLSPSPPAEALEGELFQSLAVDMVAQGQFFEILGFLYGLQDMERLVKIDSLALTTDASVDGNLEVRASIGASIFTLAVNLPTPSIDPAPETEAPAEEEPAPTTTVPAEEAAGAGTGGDT